MILELVGNNIEITEESSGESFVKIQENTKYKLCPRLRNGKYQVPLISINIIRNICKALKIPVKIGPLLAANMARLKELRTSLESIKAIDENTAIPFQLPHIGILQGDQILTPAQQITIKYVLEGQRVLIASSVGAGKTLCATSVINILKNENRIKKVLVLSRASLVTNFYDDYLKFFGNNGIVKITKETPEKRMYLYKTFMSSQQIVCVTNFEKCLFDFELLKQIKPDMIICDEFHYMRGMWSAKRSINFFELMKLWNPEWRLALTGTPVESRLLDLFPSFQYLDDGVILGSKKFFESNFVEYETVYFKIKTRYGMMTKCEEKATGFKNEEFLKGLIRPLIIKKKSKLPVGLYENWIEIDLNEKTRDKYNEVRMKYDGISEKYVRSRQFLCDTSREGLDSNQKLDQLEDILDQTEDKVLVFSFFRCSISAISALLTRKNIKFMTVMGGDGVPATEIIKKFEADPEMRVLVSTDKINMGVNIQSCNIVVNYEVPHSPSTYIQRVGRAYRLGQQRDVKVYNFICKDTVEEVIYENFKLKQTIIREIIDNLDDLNEAENVKRMERLRQYENKLQADIVNEMLRK